MRLGYAIVFVGDMRRSVAFYRDVLGLPLRLESPSWTEFATAGAALALHAAEGGEAAAGQGSVGSCRPGLAVPDLAVFHERMLASNVTCVQAPKDVFSVRIAQYLDPDGLAISVSEGR